MNPNTISTALAQRLENKKKSQEELDRLAEKINSGENLSLEEKRKLVRARAATKEQIKDEFAALVKGEMP